MTSACLAAARAYRAEVSLGVKREAALRSALNLGAFLSDDIPASSIEIGPLEPVPMPLSRHLVAAPEIYYAAEVLALCMGSEKCEILPSLVTNLLLEMATRQNVLLS